MLEEGTSQRQVAGIQGVSRKLMWLLDCKIITKRQVHKLGVYFKIEVHV